MPGLCSHERIGTGGGSVLRAMESDGTTSTR